ncbi:MAG TPA: HEAT repeat domain-containing protein [Vicinamibacterales bacterium]|nr:HEAT repeat domain-containing protein [Vicinamibacterales bacterium]
MSACAPAAVVAPPAAAAPAAPVISAERKAGWILRLEQSRVLSDAALGADLAVLARDPDAGIRRRAVVAVGRVAMPSGVPIAVTALSDPEENVRAAAAFALGLLADAQGLPALQTALKDPSPLVRGRAAEGLGLIGDGSAAPAVADAAAGCPAVIASIAPDDEAPKTGAEDACRLSILALVRLKQYDALARVVLDANGAPVSRWWPVAFALQRSADRRAAGPLAALASGPGVYTQAFAIRGLAGLKDGRAAELATRAAAGRDLDVRLRAEAIRALGRIAARDSVQMLVGLAEDRTTPAPLVLETIAAIGNIGDNRAFEVMVDLFASPSPVVRAAAMTAAARLDTEGFLLALSGRERDRDWSVRANLATVLARLPADKARPALEDLLSDSDIRVQAPALRAFAQVGGKDADGALLKALQAPDFVVRATAAALIGERRPEGGAAALAAAYVRGESDANHGARVAALDALAKYPAAESREPLTRALGDREWAVRLAAARLLRQGGVAEAAPVRPAPIRQDAAFFESDRLLRPAYTPHAYIQTRGGTIHLELNMVDAPFTTLAFIELARSGFFDGLKVHRLIPNFVIQAGDPRGDGEGGPGYAIRDELNTLPFVRGTLGMALDGRDTGGSQFFIALSPQPHLDGQYTVFGRVIEGWDLLDRVGLGDVIDRVLIRDGNER